MPLNIDQLKVDQTAIPIQDGNFAFITNINVPVRYLDNAETPETFERIRGFIAREYTPIEDIQYQFTAAYELRHLKTGQIRLFHGTFHPAGNQQASITQFRQFGADFIDHALQHLTLRNINRKLDFGDLDTAWVVHRVRSAIINVQGLTERGHHAIVRRNLQGTRNNKRTRAHVVFFLP
jgi:hypothetical protein